MNRVVKILISIALIAGAAAIISLQQGELLFTLDGYRLRATAAAAVALLILYTLAIMLVIRAWHFLFARPHQRRKTRDPLREPSDSRERSGAEAMSDQAGDVTAPKPLDAAGPVNQG